MRRPLLAAAALAFGLIAAPAARADVEAGPVAAEAPAGAYTRLDFDWTDAARQRAVPARLYLPHAASAQHRVPLVVFSHGIGGSRAGYSYLGQHWAANGYASLHVQHVGSDRSVWLGNPLAIVARLQGAAQDAEAVARVLDLHYAVDQLTGGDLGARIDAARIVVAGHSYGANTALLAVGAQVERDGRMLDFRDRRFAAAMLLSAPPFYGESDPARILAPVTVPTLHVTATDDVIRIPGYYSTAADRIAVYDAVGGPRKWLAVFRGGSHSIFTDRAGTGGAALNPQVKAATKDLSTAFLGAVFDRSDDGEALLRSWPQRFADIVARWAPAAR